MVDVARWLAELGLAQYAQRFADNGIDFEVLPDLSEPYLEQLGISLGHRKKLLRAIIDLSSTTDRHPPTNEASPLRTEAERRHLTVLMCDLVGSTELSARLDPEDMRAVMWAYQECCAEIVKRWDGHIAAYIGDGVLALFGYPRAHEDGAERAVRAGLEMAAAVGRLQVEDAPLAARVGIATGQVLAGELFGKGAHPVVGNAPTVAGRLQALARPGGVVVTGGTRRLLGRLFELADLGPTRLEGLAEPVAAFRVVGEGRVHGRFEALRGLRLTRLVGREREMDLLLDHWRRAKRGQGQVVLLSGEPGIGKSRLTQTLLDRIATEPHARPRCFCSPHHTTSALRPLVEHLQRVAGFAADDGAGTKLDKLEAMLRRSNVEVAAVAPLFAALLSIPYGSRYPPLSLGPQEQKAKTFAALVGQLEALAADPVLMVFEDAHWIDPTSAELLGAMIDRVALLPVLLIITFRPELIPPWSGQAHVSQLALSRLDQGQGAAMIEHLTGGKALPPEVSEQILAKTDGVPLFIEELTRTVLEAGLLTDAGDRYELAGPLPPLAIPATLHDSLLARLDRLVPVKEVAQIGAAIGHTFSHALLAAVAGRSAAELDAALDQLVHSELVVRRGAPPEVRYAFKHSLVRDAAYGTLLKSRRQQLHARIANALEDQLNTSTEVRPEVLAHHCTEAGMTETAVRYWHEAGQQAIARSAMTEASAQLAKGLELLADLPDGIGRRRRELDLQLALGGALGAGRGPGLSETGRAYARAVELCEQTGETALLASALHGLIVFHFSRAQLAPALALAERALAAAGEGDVTARVAGHFSIGWVNLALGRLAAARGHLERALELDAAARHSARLTYTVDLRIKILTYLSWTLLVLGYLDRARACSRDALLEAEGLRQPLTLGFALHRALTLAQLCRDVPQAAEQVTAVVALGREQAFPVYMADGRFHRGWLLVRQGAASEGAALMGEALDQLRANGDEDFLPHTLALLAEAHGAAGETMAALALVDEALARLERTDERLFEAEVHRIKARLLLPSSADRAEVCLWRAIEVARAQGAALWELRAATDVARLRAARGERDKARDLLAPVHGWFSEGLDAADLEDAKALLETLR